MLQEKRHKKLFSQAGYKQFAKDLKLLTIGEPALLRDFSSAKDKHNKWISGKVLERFFDRSCVVLNEKTGKIVKKKPCDY